MRPAQWPLHAWSGRRRIRLMKALALLLVLAFATAAIAKPRQWQNATVTKVTTDTEGTHGAVIPIGGILYGASAKRTNVYYWIKTEKITYVILGYGGPWDTHRHLNVTIGGQTKIAIDGENVHILDDAGKDRKCPLVQKIAN